jgi:hypothetical protein
LREAGIANVTHNGTHFLQIHRSGFSTIPLPVLLSPKRHHSPQNPSPLFLTLSTFNNHESLSFFSPSHLLSLQQLQKTKFHAAEKQAPPTTTKKKTQNNWINEIKSNQKTKNCFL